MGGPHPGPEGRAPLNAPVRFSRSEIFSLTAVLLLAFGASLGMAFNIDAIAISFAVGNADAGLVATLEMAAIATGNLATARFVQRLPQHRFYIGCVLVIASMNALSIVAPDLGWLIATRLPAGLALGALVATIMATAGRSDAPEQTFGLINACVGGMGIAVSWVLPRALLLGEAAPSTWALSAADGLYITYTAAAAAALMFVRLTPQPAPHSGHAAVGAGGHRWAPLFGLGLLFFGHALLGVFLVRIGREAGMAPTSIGYVLMAGGAVGIVAPLASGYLAARTRALPVVLALLCALLVLAVLLPGGTAMSYALVAPLFAALPVAVMPPLLGAAAKVDPSGRITASHPAFVMLGGAAAPLMGGWLSDQGGFAINGYSAAVCIAIAALLITPTLRAADRLRAQVQAA